MLSYLSETINIPDISVIPVDENNIYRALGMQITDSDEHLEMLIARYIDKSKKLCSPCLNYSVFDEPTFNRLKGELYLKGLTFCLGKEVASFLSKSSQLVIFTVTCGSDIEQFSKSLMKEGHMLEGLIVDIIGSELADELADYIHTQIEKLAHGANQKATNRYSPGYCNWPVSDQQNLFKLIQNNNCGIELTPSSLMIPLKSVSGMIGIGENVKKMAYKCQLCSDEKCIMRKK